MRDDVVEPARRGSWAVAEDGPYRLPASSLLGIPADPAADDVVAALGPQGAARAARDTALAPGAGADAPTLAALVEARLGPVALDRLVAPVTRGVYSLDPGLVDHRRLAPSLAERVAAGSSLTAAVAGMRAAAPPGAAVRGVRGGLWRVAERLEGELERLGVLVRTGTRVDALELDAAADTWVAGTAGPGPSLAARRVLVTVDPASGVRIAGGCAAEVVAPPTIPAVVVALLVQAPELDAFPRGTGALVAASSRAERAPLGVAAKALTHATAKWRWLAEGLPPGTHVLRLSYGPPTPGARGAVTHELDDAVLRELARRDAAAILGVELSPGRVLALDRRAWRLPVPAVRVGRGAELERARERARALPGLALAGTWIDGTGLATVVPASERAVDDLLADPR